jgi:hypothetical protein
VVRAEELQAREFSSVRFCTESVKSGPERMKLLISTVRSRCQGTAGGDAEQAAKGLAGAVVVWELWRLAVMM